ncbi:MAG: TatD family hydrolase [Bacteroidales bacterium]|nr:TatD family hydrolase [Bacteroidales bacterium]
MFVDTHTHFYDQWLLPDAEEAIERALKAGVGKMIQADVDSSERPAMWEIGNRHPGVIYQMLGLYPCSVTENWKDELDLVYALAQKVKSPSSAKNKADATEGDFTFRGERVVAIGEIGLDYHEGKEFAGLQKEVLR